VSLAIRRNLLYFYVRYLKLDLLCRHILLDAAILLHLIASFHLLPSFHHTKYMHKIFVVFAIDSISLLSLFVVFSDEPAPFFIKFIVRFLYLSIANYSSKYQLHEVNRHQSLLRLILNQCKSRNRIHSLITDYSRANLETIVSTANCKIHISFRDRTRDIE